MAAAGTDHTPRSALGYLYEAIGATAFFRRLGELGDAAILDTRVVEAHAGRQPSRADRYWSDVFAAEEIAAPWLREFTAAARESRQPVLLGGHSLVSGGLMALTDIAWREHDRAHSSQS